MTLFGMTLFGMTLFGMTLFSKGVGGGEICSPKGIKGILALLSKGIA
jgi:hypothetical protein